MTLFVFHKATPIINKYYIKKDKRNKDKYKIIYYVNKKQDKFATVANVDSTQTVTIADTLTITTNPNLLADQIISTKALSLQGSSTSGVRLGKTVLEGSADFDATAGYLRVRDNPLANDFAVNKKYVDDSVNTKLSATTDKYSISWDDTNEGLKITFKE